MEILNSDEFKKIEYFQLPKYILKLKLNYIEILIFMLAVENFKLSAKNKMVDENGNIYFYLTHEKIKIELEAGKDLIIRSIKSLEKNNILRIKKEVGKPSKYYIINNQPEIETTLKISTTQIETSRNLIENQSQNKDYHHSQNKDINKNIFNKNKNNINTMGDFQNYLKFISEKKSQNILVVEAVARKKYLSQKCDLNTLKKIMSEWDQNSEWLKNTCNWTSFLDFDFLQRISSEEFFVKAKILSEREVKILIADRTDIEFSKKLELTQKYEKGEITQEEAINGT